MPEESGDDALRSRFDEIVEGLELELPDDLTPAEPTPVVAPEPEPYVDFDDLPDEAFYREVEPLAWPELSGPVKLAWTAALGIPGFLVLCTMIGVFLPRMTVLGLCFIAVAAATYLFSRLPSRDRPDWPDDGVEL
ncbi:MAG: hypothetical protein QM621_07695 [Aeromicrobium sp.]|uniref:hypothetical protein n=1 Tax=Aeromicrobium sp. TaxID=1871063 RepID=UPI0039E67A61